MKALTAIIKKLKVGMFATKGDVNEAIEYGQSLVPKEHVASMTTALMIYHNTLLNQVQNITSDFEDSIADKPATGCGMAIVTMKEGETKGELAKRLYPNLIIDCAVPNTFVTLLTERGFDDPARHFVTAYKDHQYDNPTAGYTKMYDGVIVPITNDGIYMAAVIAQSR